MKLMHKGPGGAGELAAGEGSLELTHKRHWTAIELTTDRPAKEDWLGTSPAGDGGDQWRRDRYDSNSGGVRACAGQCATG
jgi:hypothetical protein